MVGDWRLRDRDRDFILNWSGGGEGGYGGIRVLGLLWSGFDG